MELDDSHCLVFEEGGYLSFWIIFILFYGDSIKMFFTI